MELLDVNVLVYAFRRDLPPHARCAPLVGELVSGDRAFGLPDVVLSGFLRIATHPRVFVAPSSIEDALRFAEQLRSSPACVPIAPGDRHWDIFADLCRTAGARGNLAPDAYLAALTIESGGELLTTDRDYGRLPGLRWRDVLA